MKTKLILGLVTVMAIGFSTSAQAALPAPLPEFMDKQQMAKWTADTQAAEAKAVTVDPASTQFYTGKPYVANDGGYVYKYRTYNPEMSRWTSADPSGFPDGANNFVYAKDAVTQSIDNNGLATLERGGTATEVDLRITGGGNSTWLWADVIATNTGISITNSGTDQTAQFPSSPVSYSNKKSSGTVTGGGGTSPTFSGLTGTTTMNDGGVGFNITATSTAGTDPQGHPDLTVALSVTLNGNYSTGSWQYSVVPLGLTWVWTSNPWSGTQVINYVYE